MLWDKGELARRRYASLRVIAAPIVLGVGNPVVW